MKNIILTFCVIFIVVMTSNCQSRTASSKSTDTIMQSESHSCPISLNTTKIIYMHHTNSGIAIYTTIVIREDCLVWEYHEARNDCWLKDSCKYNKKEYEGLIKNLSKIHFSATKIRDLEPVGASGYSYSFESNSNEYLHYNKYYELKGDYGQVSSLIQQFISSHETECEILFRKLSREPHERGDFGEFRTLPKDLERYQQKKVYR